MHICFCLWLYEHEEKHTSYTVKLLCVFPQDKLYGWRDIKRKRQIKENIIHCNAIICVHLNKITYSNNYYVYNYYIEIVIYIIHTDMYIYIIHNEMPFLFFRKYMCLYVPTKIISSIHWALILCHTHIFNDIYLLTLSIRLWDESLVLSQLCRCGN